MCTSVPPGRANTRNVPDREYVSRIAELASARSRHRDEPPRGEPGSGFARPRDALGDGATGSALREDHHRAAEASAREVRTSLLRGDHLDIRMRYPSPRGEVIGRLLAVVENGELRSVHASCTFRGDANAALCERIAGSLTLR